MQKGYPGWQMSLDSLLDSLESVTPVASSNTTGVTPKPAPHKDVTPVTLVTPQKTISARNSVITPKQEAAIRAWLNYIEEPEEDHDIVINKCRRDLEALAYFMKYTEQLPTSQPEPETFDILLNGYEFVSKVKKC